MSSSIRGCSTIVRLQQCIRYDLVSADRLKAIGDSHNAEREHACQRDALAKRNLHIEKVLGWPQKDEEVA